MKVAHIPESGLGTNLEKRRQALDDAEQARQLAHWQSVRMQPGWWFDLLLFFIFGALVALAGCIPAG